ncbi:MAG: hypothetical protein ACO3J1_03355 [Flavobacteriaceae bacterium]
MKLKLAFLGLLLIVCSSYAQSYVDASGADRFASTRALDDFNNLKSGFEETYDLPEDIRGSMYFDSKFKESIVLLLGAPIQEQIFLRYNAFKDEIEIGKSMEQLNTTEVLTKRTSVKVQIGDYLYIPFALDAKENDKLSYLIQIFSNKTHQLFLKKSKYFVDEKPAPSGIGGFLPARFEDKISIYYKSNKQEKPVEIKANKKSILNLFPNQEEELKKYLKKEDIKFKEVEDLILIFQKFGS